MPRFWPSVTGKFFLVLEDPAIHYVLNNNQWARIASWKDHPGYATITEASRVVDAGGEAYSHVNIVWVMDGRHWCLDLDTKNARKVAETICAPEDVDRYVAALTEQHANTAATASEYTFTEVSRSGNGYHIIYAPEGADATKFGNKDTFGCAELYKGDHGRFIILTGNAVGGADVDALPPTMGNFIAERFPKVEKVPATLPTALFEKPDAPLDNGDPWFWTGQGAQPQRAGGGVEDDASQLRFMFLNALAKQAYGMPTARERIWQAIEGSWFATVYTPQNSKNPDRFTRASKVIGVKYNEINKALMWAHLDAVKFAANREANAALVSGLVQTSIASMAQATENESYTKIKPPPKNKKLPTIPELPDSYLFNLVRSVVQKNMSKSHEGWEKITTLLTCGIITGGCFKGACPSIVVPGDSGAGKANPKKFINGITDKLVLPGALPFFDVRSSFSSGEGIRDNVSDTSILVGLLDEAGSLLTGIGSGDARYSSWQEYLTIAIDGSKINRSARAKSSKEHENSEITSPRFCGYFALQPQYMAGFLDASGIDNGVVGRLTLFPPQQRKREEAPAYVFDMLSGAEVLRGVLQMSAEVARAQQLHYVRFVDDEAIARRLHDEFPSYRVLEPIHARLGETIKRWAIISYASRHCDANGFGPGRHTWLPLEPQDVDFGFSMARMSWDTLSYYIETGDAAVGGESVKQRLIYEGVLTAIREADKRGAHTIGLSRLKVCTKGFTGRIVRGVGKVVMDEADIKGVLAELVGYGVLKAGLSGRPGGVGTVWSFEDGTKVELEGRINHL